MSSKINSFGIIYNK